MALKDYLPDFKGALKGFYEENVKATVEAKTTEFKELIKENALYGQNTQQALIAIALGIFLLLALAYFWPGNTKYLALSVLVGYLLSYLYELTQNQPLTFRHSDNDNAEKTEGEKNK